MMFWSHARVKHDSGAALMIVGLLGDTFVAVLFLRGGGWQVLYWHVPCALIWGTGVNLLTWQGKRSPTLSLNKWGLTALLLGAGTLPGFGVWTYSLAFLLVRAPFAAPSLPGALLPELDLQDGELYVIDAAEPSRAVLPLVDDVREGNTEARRAVVTRMSRANHPDATQLLRHLLSDRKAEIRSDASVALACLEDEKSRALNLAFEAWSANPGDVSLALTLAEHYYQYATSNVLDRMSQRFYLVQARDLLLQIGMEQSDRNAQLWLMLAGIRQRLGEHAEALQDVLRALHMQPDLSEASLLAMELAFATHAWDTLADLAAKEIRTCAANDPLLTSLQQWIVPRTQIYVGGR